MPDVKISALPAAGTVGGTDVVAGVQAGATVKFTMAQIATYVGGSSLAVGNTVVGGTAGSVLFINSTGKLAQDNSNFYWNTASHILSVNTGGDQSGIDSINVYNEVDAYNPNSVQGAIGSGTESGYTFSSSRGTGASPTVLSSGDLIGGISGWGYTGSVPAYTSLAGIWVTAQGVASTLGGKLDFRTRADGGALTSQLTIDNTGLASFSGRATFTTTATLPGINVGSVSGNPSTTIAGDVWYDTSNGGWLRIRNASFCYVMPTQTLPSIQGQIAWFNTTGSFSVSGGNNLFFNLTGNVLTTNRLAVLPTAVSSAWKPVAQFTGAADTALTANTEFNDFVIDLSASKTWVDGTVATQRDFWIKGRTYNKTTTSLTITAGYTSWIDRPIAGTGVSGTFYALGLGGSLLLSDTVSLQPAINFSGTGGSFNVLSNSMSLSFNLGNTGASNTYSLSFKLQNSFNTAGTNKSLLNIFQDGFNGYTFASGSNFVAALRIAPLFATSGGTTTAVAIDYRPTLTTVTGVTEYFLLSTSGSNDLTQSALSANWVPILKLTPGAHTSLTAATEFNDYLFQGSNHTWAASTALATQRFFYIKGSTATTVTGTSLYQFYVEAPSGSGYTNLYAAGISGNINVTGAFDFGSNTFTLGASGNASSVQTIQAGGSATDVGIQMFSKGQGAITIGANGNVNIAGIGTTGTTIGGSVTSSGNPPDNTFKGTGVSGSTPTLAGRAVVVGGGSGITGVAGGDVIINGGSCSVGNANGGNVYIASGNKAGTGIPGAIVFQIVFGTNAFTIDSNKNFYGNSGTTGMTTGFIFIPSAAGAPTGTPTTVSGTVPMYYDSTNNNFYIYNGAWKKVLLT